MVRFRYRSVVNIEHNIRNPMLMLELKPTGLQLSDKTASSVSVETRKPTKMKTYQAWNETHRCRPHAATAFYRNVRTMLLTCRPRRDVQN